MRNSLSIRIAVSFILLGTPSWAQEVWRCPGHRYSTSNEKGRECSIVDVGQSNGSAGTRMFVPKRLDVKPPRVVETPDPRFSGELFETQSERRLESSVIQAQEDNSSVPSVLDDLGVARMLEAALGGKQPERNMPERKQKQQAVLPTDE